jgi:hypothetical protein
MTSCLMSSMKPDLEEGAMEAPDETRPFLGVEKPEGVALANAGVGGARGFSLISLISLDGVDVVSFLPSLPALK